MNEAQAEKVRPQSLEERMRALAEAKKATAEQAKNQQEREVAGDEFKTAMNIRGDEYISRKDEEKAAAEEIATVQKTRENITLWLERFDQHVQTIQASTHAFEKTVEPIEEIRLKFVADLEELQTINDVVESEMFEDAPEIIAYKEKKQALDNAIAALNTDLDVLHQHNPELNLPDDHSEATGVLVRHYKEQHEQLEAKEKELYPKTAEGKREIFERKQAEKQLNELVEQENPYSTTYELERDGANGISPKLFEAAQQIGEDGLFELVWKKTSNFYARENENRKYRRTQGNPHGLSAVNAENRPYSEAFLESLKETLRTRLHLDWLKHEAEPYSSALALQSEKNSYMYRQDDLKQAKPDLEQALKLAKQLSNNVDLGRAQIYENPRSNDEKVVLPTVMHDQIRSLEDKVTETSRTLEDSKRIYLRAKEVNETTKSSWFNNKKVEAEKAEAASKLMYERNQQEFDRANESLAKIRELAALLKKISEHINASYKNIRPSIRANSSADTLQTVLESILTDVTRDIDRKWTPEEQSIVDNWNSRQGELKKAAQACNEARQALAQTEKLEKF